MQIGDWIVLLPSGSTTYFDYFLKLSPLIASVVAIGIYWRNGRRDRKARLKKTFQELVIEQGFLPFMHSARLLMIRNESKRSTLIKVDPTKFLEEGYKGASILHLCTGVRFEDVLTELENVFNDNTDFMVSDGLTLSAEHQSFYVILYQLGDVLMEFTPTDERVFKNFNEYWDKHPIRDVTDNHVSDFIKEYLSYATPKSH